jgi:hypothetical protein
MVWVWVEEGFAIRIYGWGKTKRCDSFSAYSLKDYDKNTTQHNKKNILRE